MQVYRRKKFNAIDLQGVVAYSLQTPLFHLSCRLFHGCVHTGSDNAHARARCRSLCEHILLHFGPFLWPNNSPVFPCFRSIILNFCRCPSFKGGILKYLHSGMPAIPFGFQRRVYYAVNQNFDFKMRIHHQNSSYERRVYESAEVRSLSWVISHK